MEQAAFFQDDLTGLGQLRVYRRPGPPEHAACEVLRETDGRAWTLRVPWGARTVLRHLLADALRFLVEGIDPEFDERGCAELARGLLAADDELVAVMLAQGDERAFAVWRRELTRQGWAWTLDVVVAPGAMAPDLCVRMLAGLEHLDHHHQPAANDHHGRGGRHPAPAMPLRFASRA